ncbi:MAG: hypothetical protein ACOX8U_05645 [Bradymonadia bacterium]|jgi:tetratricopeptide (TPR) repeat protein
MLTHLKTNIAMIAALLLFASANFAIAQETEKSEQAQEEQQDQENVVVASVERMQELFESGQLSAAIEMGEFLAAQSDATLVQLEYLGFLYAQSPAYYSKAEQIFSAIYAQNPQNLENLKNLAVIKNSLQREDALSYAILAAEASPQSAELQQFAARVADAAKDEEKAELYYARALALNKHDLVALTGLGARYSRRGEYTKVIELYEQAIEEDGVENVIVYLNLCHALLKSARYEDCISWSDKALEKYSEQGFMNAKTTALIKLKRYADAEQYLEEVDNKIKLSAESKLSLAMAKALQGCSQDEAKSCNDDETVPLCCKKDAEAFAIYEELYKSVEQEHRSRGELDLRYALSLISMKKLEDAEALLQESLDAAKEKSLPTGSYFAALAVCMWQFAQKRDLEMSVQYYREAVENAPDFLSPERLENFRQWPPMAIDVLSDIQDSTRKPKQSKSKCGCNLAENAKTPPFGELSFVLLALAGIYFIRRRELKGRR